MHEVSGLQTKADQSQCSPHSAIAPTSQRHHSKHRISIHGISIHRSSVTRKEAEPTNEYSGAASTSVPQPEETTNCRHTFRRHEQRLTVLRLGADCDVIVGYTGVDEVFMSSRHIHEAVIAVWTRRCQPLAAFRLHLVTLTRLSRP